mmetsp:Transcript_5322/g.11943  ORF Transcript_5322/g.11943 Transcript_5322/m.11943 type:complete len:984 (+) Transcript_5322:11420-14371(+)
MVDGRSGDGLDLSHHVVAGGRDGLDLVDAGDGGAHGLALVGHGHGRADRLLLVHDRCLDSDGLNLRHHRELLEGLGGEVLVRVPLDKEALEGEAAVRERCAPAREQRRRREHARVGVRRRKRHAVGGDRGRLGRGHERADTLGVHGGDAHVVLGATLENCRLLTSHEVTATDLEREVVEVGEQALFGRRREVSLGVPLHDVLGDGRAAVAAERTSRGVRHLPLGQEADAGGDRESRKLHRAGGEELAGNRGRQRVGRGRPRVRVVGEDACEARDRRRGLADRNVVAEGRRRRGRRDGHLVLVARGREIREGRVDVPLDEVLDDSAAAVRGWSVPHELERREADREELDVGRHRRGLDRRDRRWLAEREGAVALGVVRTHVHHVGLAHREAGDGVRAGVSVRNGSIAVVGRLDALLAGGHACLGARARKLRVLGLHERDVAKLREEGDAPVVAVVVHRALDINVTDRGECLEGALHGGGRRRSSERRGALAVEREAEGAGERRQALAHRGGVEGRVGAHPVVRRRGGQLRLAAHVRGVIDVPRVTVGPLVDLGTVDVLASDGGRHGVVRGGTELDLARSDALHGEGLVADPDHVIELERVGRALDHGGLALRAHDVHLESIDDLLRVCTGHADGADGRELLKLGLDGLVALSLLVPVDELGGLAVERHREETAHALLVRGDGHALNLGEAVVGRGGDDLDLRVGLLRVPLDVVAVDRSAVGRGDRVPHDLQRGAAGRSDRDGRRRLRGAASSALRRRRKRTVAAVVVRRNAREHRSARSDAGDVEGHRAGACNVLRDRHLSRGGRGEAAHVRDGDEANVVRTLGHLVHLMGERDGPGDRVGIVVDNVLRDGDRVDGVERLELLFEEERRAVDRDPRGLLVLEGELELTAEGRERRSGDSLHLVGELARVDVGGALDDLLGRNERVVADHHGAVGLEHAHVAVDARERNHPAVAASHRLAADANRVDTHIPHTGEARDCDLHLVG